MVARNSGDCRRMRRHIVVRWSVVDAVAASVAPKRRRLAAARHQQRRRPLAAHLRITVSTNYLLAGYLSDASSDEFEFETSQPEGMESMPELSFVGWTSVSAAPLVPPRQLLTAMLSEARPRQFVNTACDARPLTPPPPPPSSACYVVLAGSV